MSLDDFEQQLRRQPLREPPAAWREQILDAAHASSGTRAQDPTPTSWRNILREWLWPHPAAWGTLGACWVAILLLHQATAPSATEIAQARIEARFAAAYSALLRDPAAMAITAEPKVNPLPARSERRSPDLGRRSVVSVSTTV